MDFFSTKVVKITKEDIVKEGNLSKQSRLLKSWRE